MRLDAVSMKHHVMQKKHIAYGLTATAVLVAATAYGRQWTMPTNQIISTPAGTCDQQLQACMAESLQYIHLLRNCLNASANDEINTNPGSTCDQQLQACKDETLRYVGLLRSCLASQQSNNSKESILRV